jgi:hypothetical protein
MAISKATSATATDFAPMAAGPMSSVKRLEQALNAGNMNQAKMAFETVKQGLAAGPGAGKDLANAVSALSNALSSGDLSKANEALVGVKAEVKRVDSASQEQAKLSPKVAEPRPIEPPAVGSSRNLGLDIKA